MGSFALALEFRSSQIVTGKIVPLSGVIRAATLGW
jgi:hypothetical protein